MTLTRDPVPVIILAENVNAYVNEMTQYDLDPVDPFLYPVYDLSSAYAVSLGLPVDTTKWCCVGRDVSRSAQLFLRSVYGDQVEIHDALNVQHDDLAIRPELLR